MKRGYRHPNDNILGLEIRTLRLEKKIPVSAIAKHLEISGQQFIKYEGGKNRISSIMLWKLAKYLEIDITRFFRNFV